MTTASLNGLQKVTQEIIGFDDLQGLLLQGKQINHYIGFEISGLVHLGTGLMTGLVIRELQKLGIQTTFFLADWHTWINNKLEGDKEFIKRVARNYFAESLKLSARIAGADETKIKVVLGSDLYHNNDGYWSQFVNISKNLTLSRVIKSTTIMGRAESESMPFGFLIYPPMQVSDIFELGAHVAHAGMDQRKIHVIAREVALKVQSNRLLDKDGKKLKPIAVHHHLLLGLQKPPVWPLPDGAEKDSIRLHMKMSKSVPGSAIFIHDTPEEIQTKIRKAFCPEKEIEFNPIMNWARHLIFPLIDSLEIKREERHGGSLTIHSIEELEEVYSSGKLFSLDLKNAISSVLIDALAPARIGLASQQGLIEEIKLKQSR